MLSHKTEMPFLIAYFLVLTVQIPIWLCAGLLWTGFMVILAGSHPVGALIGGLGWGFFMWLLVGNLLAVGMAWRRAAEIPASDRALFRKALERACKTLRLIVLTESADEVVLGPKRALIRFQLQEVLVEFVDDIAVLRAPALAFGRIRKVLAREVNQETASEREKRGHSS